MKELVRRGIYFEHTPQTNPVEWGMLKSIASSDPTKWEADFLFPQHKIWLEVQGAYFHTMPGVPEKEALRFALIEAAGWRPIYWWDYDIEARLVELMDEVPEFYNPPGSAKDPDTFAARNTVTKDWTKGSKTGKGHQPWHGTGHRWGNAQPQSYWNSHHNRPRSFGRVTEKHKLPFWEGGTGIDHLKGLRTANRNRAHAPVYKAQYRREKTRRAKIAKRYRGH